MKNWVYILFLALILIPGSALANMWTNAAGHGIEAKLVSLQKGTVTLQRPKGKPFTMKLSAFCSADQKRIRRHFGMNEVPKPVSAKDLAFEKQMEHLRQLHSSGKLDDEEFRKQKRAMLTHFYEHKSK